MKPPLGVRRNQDIGGPRVVGLLRHGRPGGRDVVQRELVLGEALELVLLPRYGQDLLVEADRFAEIACVGGDHTVPRGQDVGQGAGLHVSRAITMGEFVGPAGVRRGEPVQAD